MNSKEFEKLLAPHVRSSSDIDVRIRGLREKERLPSIRGRHAPDIDSGQAAVILLSMIAQRPAEGAACAMELGDSLAVPNRGGFAKKVKLTLLEYVAGLLEKPGNVALEGVHRLEASGEYGFARIIYKDGRTLLFTRDEAQRAAIEKDASLYDGSFAYGFFRLAVFSAGFIDMLAIELAESNEVGELVHE